MVDVVEDLDWDEEEALLDERKFTVGSVLSDDLDCFEYEFVEIMANPKHEQHAEMYRWFGGPFDQRGFDVNSANARIRRLR